MQNGKSTDRGAGVTICSTAGNSHTIKNCEIKNNNANYGAAIYNKNSPLHLEGCTISGNTTKVSGTVYNGGSADAILTMSNVTITGNEAGNGGGIFIGAGSTVCISDSSVVISSNKLGNGGVSVGKGISVWNGILELSGSAKIDDDINLYNANQYVAVAGNLTQSFVATITCNGGYTLDRIVLEETGAIGGSVGITQDICERFVITPESNGTEWKIVPNADGSKGVLQPK